VPSIILMHQHSVPLEILENMRCRPTRVVNVVKEDLDEEAARVVVVVSQETSGNLWAMPSMIVPQSSATVHWSEHLRHVVAVTRGVLVRPPTVLTSRKSHQSDQDGQHPAEPARFGWLLSRIFEHAGHQRAQPAWVAPASDKFMDAS
jgi:hypothetical protein